MLLLGQQTENMGESKVMQMIWLYKLARTEVPPKQFKNNRRLKFDFSGSCFVQRFNYILKKF